MRTAYQIYLFVPSLPFEEYKQIVEQFRYHCRKSDVSWMCGFSTTSSDDAHAEYIRTGKRGRPKKMIVGSGVDAHLHDLLVGTECIWRSKKERRPPRMGELCRHRREYQPPETGIPDAPAGG